MEHREPMIFTLRTAAVHTRTSKSTILRAIKSGRLSANRLEDGSYEIDAAELVRVYPAERVKQRDTGAMEHHAPASDAVAQAAATATLEAQLEGLREIVRRADAATEELRQDRDKWRGMAEAQQRQLTDQRPRPWWQRLVG
jgi:hypothetical protein